MQSEKIPENLCVHCLRKLTGTNGYEAQILNFCGYADCPNYGLVAFGTSDLSGMGWLYKEPFMEESHD